MLRVMGAFAELKLGNDSGKSSPWRSSEPSTKGGREPSPRYVRPSWSGPPVYPENCPRRRLWDQQGDGAPVPAPGQAFLTLASFEGRGFTLVGTPGGASACVPRPV